jgi:hypothetical protein
MVAVEEVEEAAVVVAAEEEVEEAVAVVAPSYQSFLEQIFFLSF